MILSRILAEPNREWEGVVPLEPLMREGKSVGQTGSHGAGTVLQGRCNYRTKNFVVQAPTLALAKEVGETAERHRRELARLLLDGDLPDRDVPCLVNVLVSVHPDGPAETVHAVEDEEVSVWEMKLRGSSAR